MNALDVIIVVFVVIGAVAGYRRGFLSSLFWMLGIFVCWFIAIAAKNYIAAHCPSWHNLLAFLAALVAFVLSFLLVQLLGRYTRESIEQTVIGQIDNLMGGLVGGIKVFVLLSVFIYMLQVIEAPFMPKLGKGSFFYPWIESLITRVYGWASR